MRKYLLILIGLLLSGTISAQNGGKSMNQPASRTATYKSKFSVNETISRIEQTLHRLNIPVFAKFDHGKNAEEAGLSLPPNQVIVFGSPQVGTALMQENPAISIELPLKISVWQDTNGNVWINFPLMKKIAEDYGMENHPTLAKMQTLLEKIVIPLTPDEH